MHPDLPHLLQYLYTYVRKQNQTLTYRPLQCVFHASPWHTFGSGQLFLGWFKEAHGPKTAFSRDAASLFQGGRKFKPIDKESDNGTWPMRQGWGTSLRQGFLAVQAKSPSYVMWICITPVKNKTLR